MSALTRRNFLGLSGAAALSLAACAANNDAVPEGGAGSADTGSADTAAATIPEGLAISSAAWNYDADNDIYYQIGLPYCTAPQATAYESMGIYVPGAYFTASDNGDGSYTCEVNSAGAVGDWTATTAPIVMPINTAGYSAQAAPTSYSAKGVSDYTQAGLVYVFAGCRGRDVSEAPGHAPWGVTDLKAAVRTIRLNASVLPGNTDHIFSFGHSGGGAQSAVLGATGDAAGYEPYLQAIGAPTGEGVSDAIFGAMCWCPITNLDHADEAYEWNMGQFASGGTRAEGSFTQALSQDLAAAYANHINALGLTDESGTALALSEGGEGICTSGSYYDYVMSVISDSLNTFLANTQFPYTPSNDFFADMGAGGGGAPSGGGPGGEPPSDGAPSGGAPSGRPGSSEGSEGSAAAAGTPGVNQESATSDSTTYETAADYIAHLNESTEWVSYDESAGTARVTSLAGFVAACKSPSKSVGAFDALDRSQAENAVFGNDTGARLHFDTTMAQLLSQNADVYASLSDWDSSYPEDYAADLELTDAQGNDSQARQDLYNPMYYLCDCYDGAGSSTPAAHWRIRTGIQQGDTALCTELNLARAVAGVLGEDAVDFATVWGKGHTTAEVSGSSTDNFIAWIKDCAQA